MATTYGPMHVNGPATIKWAYYQNGSRTAWTELGITLGGVVINMEPKYKAAFTDAQGPDVPADYLYNGIMATFDLNLSTYVQDSYQYILAYVGDTAGTQATIGTFMVQDDQQIAILIESTLDLPFNFPTCIITTNNDTRSTQQNIPVLNVTAFPGVSNDSEADGYQLYTRTYT